MSLQYTNLKINTSAPQATSAELASAIWPGITLTDVTRARRKLLKGSIDKFATFNWRNTNAWESFGAFIINDKQSLKFYNGPGFSNEYTKPQFSDSPTITGVTFKTQTINFKIGIYWISEKDWRKFIDWLNPYEIAGLSFGFEPDYFYQVKLAKTEDTIRYIVGNETTTIGGTTTTVPMYYSEMNLSFEVQGTPCARAINMYNWNITSEVPSTDSGSVTTTAGIKQHSAQLVANQLKSDLATPLITDFHFSWNSTDVVDKLRILYQAEYGTNTVVLFDIILKNIGLLSNNIFAISATLAVSNDITVSDSNSFDLEYDSESGLLYMQYGDEKYKLLNLLTTVLSGDRLVDFMQVNKFLIPGLFNYTNFNQDNLKLVLKIMPYEDDALTTASVDIASENGMSINCRARTNVI